MIVVLSAPDSLGRVHYVKLWEESNPAWCLTCGKDPSRNCPCYGHEKTRAQHFHATSPREESQYAAHLPELR